MSHAWIGISAPNLDWKTTYTDSIGYYSVSIQSNGQLWFQVRPETSARLTYSYLLKENATKDFTQDFTVAKGYLLSLRPTGKDGPLNDGDIQFDVQGFEGGLFMLIWDVWQQNLQRYEAILPPGVYRVTAQHVPTGYFETAGTFDLGNADRIADYPLNTSYAPIMPYEPPVAARITIGQPDLQGEAAITGAPGSALPLAHVALVNLDTMRQGHVMSEADGSFTAKVYATPASGILIKHGPPMSGRWTNPANGLSIGLNPFPGTIIHVPGPKAGTGPGLPFAASGAVDYYLDSSFQSRNYVSATWSVAGTAGPVVAEGAWSRVMDGIYNGQAVPGLYLGGLSWAHPAFADLDGDGDLDLIVGDGTGHLVFYRNNGTRILPRWQFEQYGYAGVRTGWWAYPALADITGDGAPDLFVGTENGQIRIYFNRGTATVPSWPSAPDATLNTGNKNAAPALVDIDSDGDLGLFAGHSGGTLAFFRNTGTRGKPAWSLVTTAYGGINVPGESIQPAFLDVDRDGDPDLLLGHSGGLLYYRNDGPLANPTWTRIADSYMSIIGSGAPSPTIGDWDGDGRADLILEESYGILRFYHNDGPSKWTLQDFSFPFDLNADSAPALGDLNADGKLDLLVGNIFGSVYQYTNMGSTANPDWRFDGEILRLPWTNHPHAYPALADIDGDGDLDLFIGEGGLQTQKGAGGNIHYYRNDGTPKLPRWTLITDRFLDLDVGGWATPTFVDIDGDGDLDLFVGSEEGTLTFIENTGTRTSPKWDAPVRNYAGLRLGDHCAPAFLDIDGDGDIDLLAGRQDGALAYVRNDGTRYSPKWNMITTQYPVIKASERSTPVAGDLNGDGKADLLLGSGDGGLIHYQYAGPGTPAEISADQCQQDENPIKLALKPGDTLQISGRVRLHGPAITSALDPQSVTVGGWVSLMMLFNRNGEQQPAQNYFMSTLLTPSGFPIQGGPQAVYWLTNFAATDLRYADINALEGDLTIAVRLPEDLPSGVYRPVLNFSFKDVPSDKTWLAANVSRYTYFANQAALPPMAVGTVKPPRLVWRLLMDDLVQGVHGTGAREDKGAFGFTSQIVSQDANYYTPPGDVRTGDPITYRLEPFIPAISNADRNLPSPPLIPFALPGGQLSVQIQSPDGTVTDLGSAPFIQSFNRTKTTLGGLDLNASTVQLSDVYSLTTGDKRFRTTFSQYGHHVITMKGAINDVWGNKYEAGGTYDLWIAHPLNIAFGVLPGTPFQVGDTYNSTIQLYPRVPADISITITQYPNSDLSKAITQTASGKANNYGYFAPAGQTLRLSSPGEYRVALTASFKASDGELYMGTVIWGGVVETPNSRLVAHGRRGIDNMAYIPNHWFMACRDLKFPPGGIGHTLNPYYNGDILWSRQTDDRCGGQNLVLGASIQDTGGDIEAVIRNRADRMLPGLSNPGTLAERFEAGEIPLFISTHNGGPAQLFPEDIDQVAYSYRSSHRAGSRVREVVTEDGQSGGYWSFSTMYDDQLGVGVLGDLPNDFKFQYIGTVYHDLDAGIHEYGIQGSLWIFVPDNDPAGSRVMPPFAGSGNGGWTTEGGPILKLKGQDIHMFILPTGTQPGAVLEEGDLFRFAGHIAPTLNSQVEVKVTSPDGRAQLINGRANKIGYFYNPSGDFTVDQAGLWSVDVRIWHDGTCSGGQTVPPYPSGDVLGSESGRYWFYVVSRGTPRLNISSPKTGFLTFKDTVSPVTITGPAPAGIADGVADYTIMMPGYILRHGQAKVENGTYSITFDPASLHGDFPNLDLSGRDNTWAPGLSDTFSINLLLQGKDASGKSIYRAGTVTMQGEQVFIENDLVPDLPPAAATLVSPSGAIKTTVPTYTWNAVRNASHYQLWANDSSAEGRIQRWFTAAEARCPSGTGACSATSSIGLAQGAAVWWIRTWNPVGYGPWSAPSYFTVAESGELPGKAKLVSPSGGATSNTPAFIWNAVPAAAWYYLWVSDSAGGARIQKWYRSAEAGCSAGNGDCSIQSSSALTAGSFLWWVQTWNENGYGPWSDGMSFTITTSGPPGKAALIGPSGTVNTSTPVYSWNAVPGATWYQLWVNDSTTSSGKIKAWYTAQQAACASGTGICSITPTIPLTPGAGQWWIQTWNESGYGLWSDGMSFMVAATATEH